MWNTKTLVVACATATLLGACADDDSIVNETNGSTNSPDITERRLTQFDNSEDFYGALREALINQGDNQDQNFDTDDALINEVDFEESIGAESDDSVSDSADESTAADGNEVTSTNVQELGVDEQDRVKISADGSRLYVLNSGYSDGPGFEEDSVEIDIESDSPIEISPEAYQTVLRVMSVDAQTPDTQSLAEVSIDLQGGYADGFYLYENGDDTNAIVTSTGSGYWGNWNDSSAFYDQSSVLSKVDLSDPASANVSASIQIDGQIISSRRIGSHLFFASRYYPAIDGDQPWTLTQDQWEDIVNGTDMASLLPQYTRTDTGESQALIDPSECFVASTGADQPYYSPDIITLGSINLDTMQLSDGQCFLGSTETLYASTEAIYLATTQYDYGQGPMTEGGELVDVASDSIVVDEPWFDPRVDTDIHQFDIDSGSLVYAGSGTVSGHLGWDPLRKPFRMSAREDYLRVATMNDEQGPDHSPILLSVLQPDGQGNLELVSRLPNEEKPEHIGKPGEQLYASRFVDDRAYLVTFLQTDPLYVIDLSTPSNPALLGELEIEGYSDYLHPVDDNLMLGIGMDAVAAQDNFDDGRGALVQGMKLSLFDVSNPVTPTEIQSVLVGQRGTYSVALYNHRAITIQAATDDHPTRVSFGINVHGQAEPAGSPTPQDAFNYYDWSYTGLHGFDIQTGDGAGIVRRGAMVVETANNNGEYQYGPLKGDDRSVMVGDAVFYIHGDDVYSAHWDNLSTVSPAR